MLIITHESDYFFGVFLGGALMALNLFLHSVEISSMVNSGNFSVVGSYFGRYLILACGFFVSGFISFQWLMGTMVGVFLYFPAVYIGSLKNIKFQGKG